MSISTDVTESSSSDQTETPQEPADLPITLILTLGTSVAVVTAVSFLARYHMAVSALIID